MWVSQKNLEYLAQKRRLEEKGGYFRCLKGCHMCDDLNFIYVVTPVGRRTMGNLKVQVDKSPINVRKGSF